MLKLYHVCIAKIKLIRNMYICCLLISKIFLNVPILIYFVKNTFNITYIITLYYICHFRR